MASCPVRAEQVLESHGRPLRITLSRPSDCAKYEITLDVALHFGPEDHSCAEKLNKNNDQVGRETLQLFKSGRNKRLGRSTPQPERQTGQTPAAIASGKPHLGRGRASRPAGSTKTACAVVGSGGSQDGHTPRAADRGAQERPDGCAGRGERSGRGGQSR